MIEVDASAQAQLSKAARNAGRLRWWMLGWALLAGMINYMDRMGVSIAAPAMMSEFGFNRTDIGLIGAAFSWAYAFGQLPSGWLVDKFGARRMYSVAIAGWSLATAFMAMGSHLWHFLIYRTLLGVAEAPNGPASAKLTADWFPRSERGQATAIWDSGSKWGPALAPPILTALLLAFGWRSIFIFLGVVGLIIAAALAVYYRSPEDHPRITKQELELIQTGRESVALKGAKVSWGALFKYRQIWGMMAGYFCIIWTWNIFIVFLPLYLQEARGVSIGGSGILASLPYLGAGFIGIFGGYVMTKYTAVRNCDPLVGKRHILCGAAVLLGILVCATPFAKSVTVTVLLVMVSLGLIATMAAAAWAIPGDIVTGAQVGSVGAIQNFGGYFGGALSPVVTGMIADASGSYTLSFIIAGIIASLAAVAYTLLVREPIEARPAASNPAAGTSQKPAS